MTTYRRINKTMARKAYENGKTVFLNPSKFTFPNLWHTHIAIRKGDEMHEYLSTADFDSRVNNFIWYNCSWESGYYPHYYIIDKADNIVAESIYS